MSNIGHLSKLADPSQTFLEQIAVFILSYVVFVYLDIVLCVHTIICCGCVNILPSKQLCSDVSTDAK